MKKIIILAILVLSCWTVPAQAIQLSPDWLTDTTGQITPQTKAKVNELSQLFQRDRSLAIYTLVTSGTEDGLDTHRYIQQVFAENQLTSKDTLVLLDIADRKVEIFSGVDSQVSDETVRAAIAKAKPFLAASNWNAGTIALVGTITAIVGFSSNLLAIIALLLILVVVAAIFVPDSGRYGSSGGYYYDDSSSSGGGSGGDSF